MTRPGVVVFDCEDCAARVYDFRLQPGVQPGPAVADALCASCRWIREHVPAAEQPAMRERLGVPLAEGRH